MKCLHIRFMSRKAATIKNEKKKLPRALPKSMTGITFQLLIFKPTVCDQQNQHSTCNTAAACPLQGVLC